MAVKPEKKQQQELLMLEIINQSNKTLRTINR